MSRPEPAPRPGAAAADTVGSVARGGAANLVGAVVYGASNFVVLIVLTRALGVDDAGVVIVAIALFNMVSTMSSLGCSTGLIRMISRDRATGHPERLAAMVRVAVVPVAIVSTLAALGSLMVAGRFAELLADGDEVERVAAVLRAMAPFIPVAALHIVLVQGTRGFNTMLPQVLIERIGRAIALPVVVGGAAAMGMGPRGVGAAWAATNVVALVFSARAMYTRVGRATVSAGTEPVPLDRAIARDFWSFTGPRAVGQASDVTINWVDTVLVGAIISTTAAGIYAAGTRYLLPGLFAAEALMQVTGPRISGLMATRQPREASRLLQVVAGWQVTVMWPLYLLIALFPTPLLQVFGPEVVEARGALIALAVAMLLAAPLGPAPSVILMAGRSTQAMFNTLAVLVVNIAGNLILVPAHGITAAGIVWGATLLLVSVLPAWQARRSLSVQTLGSPALRAAVIAAATLGVVGVLSRLAIGDEVTGLAVAGSLGTAAYVAVLWRSRSQLHLDALWDGLRRRSGVSGPTTVGMAEGTDERT